MLRAVTASLVLGLSLLVSGCIGAMQTTAEEPRGAADLKPTQEDRDAGLVGIRSGLDLKTYQVVVVNAFKVTATAATTCGSRSTTWRVTSGSSSSG